MRKTLTWVSSLLFFLSGLSHLHSQCRYNSITGKMEDLSGRGCINSLITAVPFLKQNPDARSGGMGDVGLALEGTGALYNNASLLAFSNKKISISATYSPWLSVFDNQNVNVAYLSGFAKINDQQTVGASIRYFSIGKITYTDANGAPLFTSRPKDFEGLISYSRKLSNHFSAAIGLKYIYSYLASDITIGGNSIKPGISGAADLSFSYNKPMGDNSFTAGLALTNLGNKISVIKNIKEYIPANLGIGAAYSWNLSTYNKLTVAMDVNKLLVPSPYRSNHPEYDTNKDNIPDYKQYDVVSSWFRSFGDAPNGFNEELQELMFSLGLEYWYNNKFALRSGYYSENRLKGDRKFLTFGVGVKYKVLGMNVSYQIPKSSNLIQYSKILKLALVLDIDQKQHSED